MRRLDDDESDCAEFCQDDDDESDDSPSRLMGSSHSHSHGGADHSHAHFHKDHSHGQPGRIRSRHSSIDATSDAMRVASIGSAARAAGGHSHDGHGHSHDHSHDGHGHSHEGHGHSHSHHGRTPLADASHDDVETPETRRFDIRYAQSVPMKGKGSVVEGVSLLSSCVPFAELGAGLALQRWKQRPRTSTWVISRRSTCMPSTRSRLSRWLFRCAG